MGKNWNRATYTYKLVEEACQLEDAEVPSSSY